MKFGITDITVFIAFIAGVVGLGLWKSKASTKPGSDSAADYFLAGRGLSWWLIGISLIAANISAEQFVGMSGSAAGSIGLGIASYEWMAAVTLIIVAFAFLPYFLKSGIYTIPQFLEVRYNPLARTIMAVLMMVILIGVSLSGVIYAGALAMRDLLELYNVHMSIAAACWLMGIMAAIYVAAGGLKACAWADLIQGSALIIGGGIIAYFAFEALQAAPVASLTPAVGGIAPTLADNASGFERLFQLNSSKMHMVLPKSNTDIPWTALLIGLWIPNLYYWGLNQYITQRLLGSSSLKEGQKGLVFAAALKLVIPFLIVFPGLIAFNLYSTDMADKAERDFLSVYEKAIADPASTYVFTCHDSWSVKNIAKAAEINAYNLRKQEQAKTQNLKLTEKIQAQYKTDSALGLLIGKLIKPGSGILGFVLAALFGAIVSSLAAVLNAASTIFTMDIYDKYIQKNAPHKTLVKVGRVCIGVFVVFGCLVSPMLDDPKFGGIFKYIQEFQGFVSPGILAAFVFGLFNRTAHGITGVLALALNPILYGVLGYAMPQLSFLDRMAVCFFSMLALMWVIGLFWRLPKPVVFESNTKLDTSTSYGALIAGIGVIYATVVLYMVFR